MAILRMPNYPWLILPHGNHKIIKLEVSHVRDRDLVPTFKFIVSLQIVRYVMARGIPMGCTRQRAQPGQQSISIIISPSVWVTQHNTHCGRETTLQQSSSERLAQSARALHKLWSLEFREACRDPAFVSSLARGREGGRGGGGNRPSRWEDKMPASDC